MAQNKYLDLTGLGEFKGLIDVELAKSFKSAKFDESTRILSLYKTETTTGTADFTVEIPETDVSGLLEKLTTTNVGNVLITKADGTIEDGGVKLADLATKAEVTSLADGAVKTNTEAIATLNGDETTNGSVKKAVKDSADAINATIGTVPDGQTVMGIIENIQENAYDDTELKGLIQDNTDAIAEINDTDNGILAQSKTYADTAVETAVNEVKANLASALTYKGQKATVSELPDSDNKCGDVWTVLTTDNGTSAEFVWVVDDEVASTGHWEELGTALDMTAYAEKSTVTTDIATAKSEAISSASTDATTKADKALEDAKGYADGLAVNYDSAGSASAAQTNAQNYADGLNTAMDTRVTDLESKVATSISSDEISALFSN